MQKIVKNIIIAISSLLCVILTYTYLCFIFLPKSINDQGGESYYRGKSFVAEPLKHSLDIIAFGHSSVYSAFSPIALYNTFGYTSYSSGVALQTIDNINIIAAKAKDIQKPKIAILDVDCLYLPLIKNSVWLKLGAPFVYHSRWKTLKGRDFYKMPGKVTSIDQSKGFIMSKKIAKFTRKDYMGAENSAPLKIRGKNKRELDKFVNFCKQNNIKLLFVDFVNMHTWNYAKHNYIASYAKENNIDFLDMNITKDTIDIDYDRDFRDDGDHYNVYGAEKATKFIGEYLQKKYGDILADKRNDPTYHYWQDAVNYYNNQLQAE